MGTKRGKGKMNEIVNQHNDLIDLPLRRFNASEIDILMALCNQCQEKGTTQVVLPLNQIRKLSHFMNKNESQFVDSIRKTNEKLLGLNFTIGTERKFVQFVLFPTFEVDQDNGTLTVQVHERFAYLLNNLTENYTALELQESVTLRSAYSKAIYKKLRRFRSTGIWRVSLENFKVYLDIPSSYSNAEITRTVINPSIEELKPFFTELKCTPYYDKNHKGRGRRPIAGYEFTFDKKIVPEAPASTAADHQERIAASSEWEKTPRFCPKCHRPIYSKPMENENGMYTLYGHLDWKTGPCQYTTTHFEDLLEERQVKELEEKNKPLTAEQEANKSKLSAMLKNMFKSS